MAVSGIYNESQLEKLNKMLTELEKDAEEQKAVENELLGLQISNAEKLLAKKKEILQKEQREKIAAEQAFYEKALELGVESEKARKRYTLQKEAAEEKEAATKASKEAISKITATDKEERKAQIKKIKEAEKQKKKEIEAQYKEDLKVFNKTLTTKEKLALASAKNAVQAEARERIKSENAANLFGEGKTLKERKDAASNLLKNPGALVSALADLAKQLDNTIEEIARSRSAIDTRLQGSKAKTKGGSYWDQISSDITSGIGASPLVKQADVVENLKTMVGKGISFNVEQRAFLDTISDKIATTFDATNASLVKLVRIQQQDTTAARLGMESALTSFLNNMYETTEYMSDMATSVKNNIYEASALMTAKSATEFEYQIQKWLGSLYSVGFGTDISGALGNLAAGNISSISDGGVGNLLIMAANRANMSIAEVLSDGLDSSETNQLMQAMVDYLGEIYSETKGSNILAQQYAGVFGLTASDLKAAANLSKSTKNIAGNNLNYNGLMMQLSNMANSMGSRISLGERLSNAFANFQYSTAAGIANNPALYSIYKIAGLLDATTGGIDFSLPTIMGTGMAAQTFNVADIMQVAALSGSILGGLGSMLGGLVSNGSGLLSKFGITNSPAVVSRGTGGGLPTTSGMTVSESGYTANSNSSDIQNKAMTDTKDDANSQTVSASEEDEEKTMTDVDESLIRIYDLLSTVVDGRSIRVSVGDETSWSNVIKSTITY